jgi:hypothetical protein
MDEYNDITLDTQGDESHVNSAPVEETVNDVPRNTTNDQLTLAEINSILGKDFKDKSVALASLKEMQSYTGKRKEDFFKEWSQTSGTEQLSKEIKIMRENMFYQQNPHLNKPEYRELISKLGENPEEVVQMPAFKAVIEKAQGYEESQSLKTVLNSNPRLASQQDALAKAREAMAAGKIDDVESLVTKAVLGL